MSLTYWKIHINMAPEIKKNFDLNFGDIFAQ